MNSIILPSCAIGLSERPRVAESRRCYVVLMRHGDREVFLLRAGAHAEIPEVEVPCHQRVAPNLLPAVERRLGLTAIARFSMPAGDLYVDGRCIILDTLEDGCSREDGFWTGIEGIPWNTMCPGEGVLLRSALEQVRQYNRRAFPARFVQPRWLDGVRDWVKGALTPHGLRLRGIRAQYNMGPNYSLLRFATDQSDIWFKAVGSDHRREFTITRCLGEIDLPCVAPVLAIHEGWNAWLTPDCYGTELDAQSCLSAWNSAARGLARLQIASIPNTERLLAAGCRDLRAPALEDSIEPFLSDLAGLVACQKSNTVRRLTLPDLRLIETQLRLACRALQTMALPNTLGHSDLNPGNVLVGGDGPVFLDWMEGHVGSPLLSFEYLQSVKRRIAGNPQDQFDDLRSVYRSGWSGMFSARDMNRALHLIALLAPFAYAVTCHDPRCGDHEASPELAALLRSLGRRMLTEAEKLVTDGVRPGRGASPWLSFSGRKQRERKERR